MKYATSGVKRSYKEAAGYDTSVVFISRNKLIALRLTAREFKSRRRVRIGGEKVLKS